MAVYTQEELKAQQKYLCLLAKKYPTVQSAFTEIINLQAILQLPKGTEHFMSDLHGEHEAFTHILNNCSGVIMDKIDGLLSKNVSAQERAELATLIYYPEIKLKEIQKREKNYNEWCVITLYRLIDLCRLVSGKYTRSKVRKALPADYSYIIDELLNADYNEHNKDEYYEKIIDTIIKLGLAKNFIIALSDVIKRLAVDRLHIIGDIFDRGKRADLIMDRLMDHHSVDIQWGNHDILWMGAAAGSGACIVNVIANSLRYHNFEVLEMGYGINLRSLTIFAQDTYKPSKVFYPHCPKGESHTQKDLSLLSQLYKAVTVIRFKLEGQIIKRHPEYDMEDRLFLHRLNLETGTVELDGKIYKLTDCDFPTVFANDPYALTLEEQELLTDLTASFVHCERLQKQVKFLFEKGNIYKCHNGNLLYHSCIPMRENGSFETLIVDGKAVSGKAMMDAAERMVRKSYFLPSDNAQKDFALDFVWYLWCGKKSPLFGREKMASFELLYIDDSSTWDEPQNPYYELHDREDICNDILHEFGLTHPNAHIFNGHVPVRVREGESPIKANGKLIVIDGGLCKAYQSTTGIAGYTLIYNSHCMRLVAHQSFEGLKNTIENNLDIHSSSVIFETMQNRVNVKDTDSGLEIMDQIEDLNKLVAAYQMGIV